MHFLQRYATLLGRIEKTHIENGGEFYCHDFDHVIRVALTALTIAEDEKVGQLAALAGLCHNADRILQKMRTSDAHSRIPHELVANLVHAWLMAEPEISQKGRVNIVYAVLFHGEPNQPNDTPVLIALKDADRVVNTELDVVMRHAQYYPDLPRLHPNHLLDIPGDGFRTPKSVLGNLLITRREWMEEDGVASIRLPKARELMKSRLAKLEQYAKDVLAQREESGLVPYPVHYPEFV